MATRSAIGLKLSDGTIQAVYCHWDGYLENNGQILLDDYKTVQDVQKIIDKGYLSSLEGLDGGHNNDDIEAGTYKDETDFVNNFAYGGVHYYYLFKNNNWYVSYGRDFGLLTQEDIDEAKKE